MSLIFTGLSRLRYDDYEGEDQEIIFPTGDDISYGIEERKIHCHTILTEDFPSLKLINANQKFVLHSTKKYVLQNVSYFTPTIMFFFKPEYSVQIAVRFVIKLISGYTETKHIEAILARNMKIYNFFKEFLAISEYVYRGDVLIHFMTNETLNKKLIAALIENISLQRGEEANHPSVTPEILTFWGDSNGIFNQTNVTQDKDKLRRKENTEICLYQANFCCVICTALFNSSEELKIHSITHKSYECIGCDIEFASYPNLLAHSLTFCRRPILVKSCEICGLKTNCNCAVLTQSIFEVVQNFVKSQYNCPIYSSMLFSHMYNFFCQNNTHTFIKGLYKSDKNETVKLKIEEIKIILSDSFPIFSLSTGTVTCAALSMQEIKVSKIKQYFIDYFSDGNHLLKYIARWLSNLIDLCPVCGDKYSGGHFKEHYQCPFSIQHSSDELSILYQNSEEALEHVKTHKINVSKVLSCSFCDYILCDTKELKIKNSLHHMEGHNDYASVMDKCQYTACNERFCTVYDFLVHTIINHCDSETKFMEILQIYFRVKHEDDFQLGDFSRNLSEDFLTPKKYNSDELMSIRPSLSKKNQLESKVKVGQQEFPKVALSQGHSFDLKAKSVSQTEFTGIQTNHSTQNSDSYVCLNEEHTISPHFANALLKKKHLISMHSCPFPKCTSFFEMNSDMLIHIKIMHNETENKKCPVCQVTILDLEMHLKTHQAVCSSCQEIQIDQVALIEHEKSCKSIQRKMGGNENSSSLLADSNNSEFNFLQTLKLILETSNMGAEAKEKSKEHFEKYVSQLALSKARDREEFISIRRGSELFFDLPSFSVSTNSNSFQKILQSIGTVSQNDKFAACSSQANKNAIIYFEALDALIKKIDRYTQIGNLSEKQAIFLFETFLVQKNVDEINSFNSVTELKYISFKGIISSCQFLYVPLQLRNFLSIVMNYRLNPHHENFLTFASRCTRHLVLCSRMHKQEKREEFVESNRRLVFKQNLPQSLLTKLEAKEKIYSHFSSSEILEIVVSSEEECSLSFKNNDSQFERYRVFSIKNNSGTLRPQPKGEKKDRNGRIGNFSQNKIKSDEKFRESKILEIKSNDVNYSESTRKKLDILAKFGLAKPKNKVICFFCLGEHASVQCDIYTEYEPLNRLCIKTQEGKQWLEGKGRVYGFHSQAKCKHRSHERYAFNVNRPSASQSNSRQGADNSAWKILRKN